MVRTAVRGFCLAVFSLLFCVVAPVGAFADPGTGGASYTPPPPPTPDPSTVPLGQPKPLVPRTRAGLLADGTAAPPAPGPQRGPGGSPKAARARRARRAARGRHRRRPGRRAAERAERDMG